VTLNRNSSDLEGSGHWLVLVPPLVVEVIGACVE